MNDRQALQHVDEQHRAGKAGGDYAEHPGQEGQDQRHGEDGDKGVRHFQGMQVWPRAQCAAG